MGRSPARNRRSSTALASDSADARTDSAATDGDHDSDHADDHAPEGAEGATRGPDEIAAAARHPLDRTLLPVFRRAGVVSDDDLRFADVWSERDDDSRYGLLQRLLLSGRMSLDRFNGGLETANHCLIECPGCARTVPRSRALELGRCPECRERLPREAVSRSTLSAVEILTAKVPSDLALQLPAEGATENPLMQYVVQSERGRGGFGVVFQVLDLKLQRLSALKVVRSTGKKKPEIERFIREGKAMARLDHPNIVRVFDVGRQGDVLFIVMEDIEGESFRDMLRDEHELDEALDIFETVLEAVEHAHRDGVLHRDLKPSNVLVPAGTREGRLFDFGLAKDLEKPGSVTETREVVGTPFYTSPEHITLGAPKIDARSDVFALGVMLYEILVGERPFVDRARSEVYARILYSDPTPPSEAGDCPKVYDAVVERALAKDRKQRTPSAAALLEDLRAARAAAVGPSPPTRRRRHRSSVTSGYRSRRGSGSRVAGGLRKGSSGVGKAARRRALCRTRSSGLSTGGWIVFVVILVMAFLLGLLLTPAHGQAGPELPPLEPPKPAKPEPATPEPAKPEPVAPEPATPGSDKGAEPEGPPRPEPGFPELQGKEWIARAFFTNELAELPDDFEAIRGLRIALRDDHELVRGFALRGLLRRPLPALRRWGGVALGEGLVEICGAKESWPRRNARELLTRLVPGAPDSEASEHAVKRWFKERGEAALKRGERPPPAQPPGARKADPKAAPKPGEAKDKARPIATRERLDRSKEPARYFTEVRERGLEVVFVVDVTSSMSDELERVRRQVQELTGFFLHLLPKKVRLGLVTYDNAVVGALRLTGRLSAFARVAGELEVYRNPNNRTWCEGLDKGLETALNRRSMGWLRKTMKSVVILGDAPPHAADRARTVKLAAAAKQAGVTVSAIITPPPKVVPGAEPHGPIRAITKAGGGMAVDLDNPEDLITRLLVLSFGARYEDDLRRFVTAYREVTREAGRSQNGKPLRR